MNIQLTDSKEYNKETFSDSFDILIKEGLIETVKPNISYKVKFVGEVITPYDQIISVPKNFTVENESSISLTKEILKEYYRLKRSGKLLLTNRTFTIGGDIESEQVYWKKLYSYFIDFVTYEFYYPKKKSIIHSLQKKHGRINPLLTDKNRERVGLGVTYEIKNLNENDFRNIYYSTLKNLEAEFATESEKARIRDMENYLRSQKYIFKYLELKE